PQYLEKLLHFTPVQAGSGIIPLMFTYAITSFFAGKVYIALGARMSIFLGFLITSIGTFGIVLFGFSGSYFHLVIPFSICGVGTGIALACINTAAVGTVKESRSSLAGGLTMMFQMSGAALGLAIVTTIFVVTSTNELLSRITTLGIDLSPSNIENIKSFIIGSGTEQTLVNDMGKQTVDKLVPHIKASYINGLRIGLSFTGTLLLFGAFFTLFKKKKFNSND
ncbi:MAG: MFS transporter, partial [Thermodesulfobacteriota bacterium]